MKHENQKKNNQWISIHKHFLILFLCVSLTLFQLFGEGFMCNCMLVNLRKLKNSAQRKPYNECNNITYSRQSKILVENIIHRIQLGNLKLHSKNWGILWIMVVTICQINFLTLSPPTFAFMLIMKAFFHSV